MDPIFKSKYATWVACLRGTDHNSIRNQINRQTWDLMVFKAIQAARLQAPRSKDGGLQINPMFHRFINYSFFQVQATTIRRMTDRSGLTGKWGVHSLASLIQDLIGNASMLTRENLMDARGVSLNPESLRKREEAFLAQAWQCGTDSVMIPPDIDYAIAEDAHRNLDAVCHLSAATRTPKDTVRGDLLEAMRDRLGECRPIINYVDKFIAHAATPESRQPLTDEEMRVDLAGITKAHEVFCRVAHILELNILAGSDPGFFIHASGNSFAHFDQPLCRADQYESLENEWGQMRGAMEAWTTGNVEWCMKQDRSET